MKTIVLAAGRGSRLGSLTDDKPKALVRLNGVPLIRRCTDSLRAGGASSVGIVAGYKREMLATYADRVFANEQWDRTGIFQSLICADEWLREEACIVSYGDIFYDANLVTDLIHCNADVSIAYDPNAVALWSQRFERPLDDLERFTIDHGRITSIGGRARSLDDVQGQYMGLFKLTPVGWQQLLRMRETLAPSARSGVDMTSLFAALIQADFPIVGVPTAAAWGEIDCPSDVALYERIYPAI